MPMSKAAIRHAELIETEALMAEFTCGKQIREAGFFSAVFLPKDPALISHSACYVFSPKGVHGASFNSFSNLTVNVSRGLISRR